MTRRGGGDIARLAVNLAAWILILTLMVAFAAGTSWVILRLGAEAFDRARALADRPSPDHAEAMPAGVGVVPDPAPAPEGVNPTSEGKRGDPIYRNASWLRQPAPRYPPSAIRAKVAAGEVVLECEALAEGVLGACEVLDESPTGVGFADAALASMREARMRPSSINDRPVDGRVRFTVRFRLD